MTTRELLQMALEFIESVHEGEWAADINRDSLQETLRAHLAKPEPTPVAWMDTKLGVYDCVQRFDDYTPLYTKDQL
jgi:hypothetical protein